MFQRCCEDKCRKSDFVQNKTEDLNYNGGITSQYVLTTILAESDKQHARQQSQLKKEEGTTLMEWLRKFNRTITDGKMILGLRWLGLKLNSRGHVQDMGNKKKEDNLARKRHEDLNYMKLCFKADQVTE